MIMRIINLALAPGKPRKLHIHIKHLCVQDWNRLRSTNLEPINKNSLLSDLEGAGGGSLLNMQALEEHVVSMKASRRVAVANTGSFAGAYLLNLLLQSQL